MKPIDTNDPIIQKVIEYLDYMTKEKSTKKPKKIKPVWKTIERKVGDINYRWELCGGRDHEIYRTNLKTNEENLKIWFPYSLGENDFIKFVEGDIKIIEENNKVSVENE